MRRQPKRKATRRANAPLLGEVMKKLDPRVWFALGLVIEDGDDGFDSHSGKDVTVRVELQPGGEIVRCRVGATCAGPGYGMWSVPPVGAEVAVGFPDGELDAGGIVTAVLSTGAIPDGVGTSSIVLVVPPGGKVYIRDADGATKRLATIDELLHHTHPTGVGPSAETIEPHQGTSSLEAQ